MLIAVVVNFVSAVSFITHLQRREPAIWNRLSGEQSGLFDMKTQLRVSHYVLSKKYVVEGSPQSRGLADRFRLTIFVVLGNFVALSALTIYILSETGA